jgi:DeoR/GlpR family transcriptional regulator of sugar metabolism
MEAVRAVKRNSPEAPTVIGRALNIAVELADSPNVSLIMTGGMFRHVYRSFAGPPAERIMSDLHADRFFPGVNGLDPQTGPSTPGMLEAQLNAQMLQAAGGVSAPTDEVWTTEPMPDKRQLEH